MIDYGDSFYQMSYENHFENAKPLHQEESNFNVMFNIFERKGSQIIPFSYSSYFNISLQASTKTADREE